MGGNIVSYLQMLDTGDWDRAIVSSVGVSIHAAHSGPLSLDGVTDDPSHCFMFWICAVLCSGFGNARRAAVVV